MVEGTHPRPRGGPRREPRDAVDAVAAGRRGPSQLVTDSVRLRQVLTRTRAHGTADALVVRDRLAAAEGVAQVVVDGITLELTDTGHRALWRLLLTRVAHDAGRAAPGPSGPAPGPVAAPPRTRRSPPGTRGDRPD